MASRLLAGLAVVCLLALSACMGEADESARVASVTAPPTSSGEATTTTTEAEPTATVEAAPPVLTHRQLVRQLDRICRTGNRGLRRVNERIEAAYSSGEYDRAADIWERNSRRVDRPFYASVEALAVPPRDQRGVDRYLELTRQIDVLEKRYVRELRQNDTEEMTRLQSLMDGLANRRTLVTSRLGLTECGS